MAKVSLRIYNREIENLVESNQLDEAIAHCRHILNAFPKNLETYRLIGKAYLEAKRYKEATDIFERLLMAVPDDFVAHVGMSIIHDEQNSMDAAIWHMERAFEVQPSNAAIQAELQRLFGRRDGVEPPKIRLTRGALAHMYVQGELYPQAIAEIKSVLDEDPERQDMQVLLARAYFHAGQKSEAAEICSQLLRRYPYCFDANRVLTELIPQTERGESTQVYRHRISELDPYSTFATGSVFHSEEVPDAAVSLEHLEWDGQPVGMQPEWGDALGINRRDKPAERDERPAWLKAAMSEDSTPASTPDEKPASLSGSDISAEDDQIPEFLREAGWGEDTGTFQEGSGTFDQSGDDTAEGEIAEGELPDWVKAMAPAGADKENDSLSSESTGQEDLTEDEVSEWLQGLGDVQSTPSDEEEQPVAPAGELPDWLQSMKPEEVPQPEAQDIPEEEPISDEGIPDWLQSMESEETPQPEAQDVSAEEPAGDEGPPDWLQSMKAEEAPQPESQELPEEELASDGGLPDWLQSMKPEETPQPESQEVPEEELASDEGLPDWLQSMKPEEISQPESQEIHEEEPVSDEGMPDWLQSMESEEQPEVEAALQEPVDVPPESLSDWQIGDETSEAGEVDLGSLGTSAEEQDDALAWLESLASKHGAKPEELVTDPNARKDTAPEWVQKASQAGTEQPPIEDILEPQQAEEPPSPVDEPEPEIPQPTAPSAGMDDLGTTAEEQDDAMAWLESLASKHGAKPEELVTDPNARKDTAPEWVQKAAQVGAEQPPIEDIPEPQQEVEPPSQVDEPEPEIPQPTAPSAGVDDLGTSAEEQDDAMAWLESLASKHGAKPEELVTDPDARKETAPEWVQKAAQASVEQPLVEESAALVEEETAEGEPEWMQNAEEVGESLFSELEEAQTKEPVPSTDMDETGMWLSQLDAEEGGSSDEQQAEPATQGDLPDWLSSLDVEQPDQAPPVSESVSQHVEEAEPTSEADLPAWLDGLEDEPSEQGEPSVTEATSGSEAEAEPEPPEWLHSMEARVSESDESIESSQKEEAEGLPSWLEGLEKDEGQESAAPSEELPGWLKDEAELDVSELEPTSPTDWNPEDAAEPVQASLEPEHEELLPEPEFEQTPPAEPVESAPIPEPIAPPEREPYREPVTRSRTGMTGMLSSTQDPILIAAQNELTRSNIPAALGYYEKLIKKGKMLDEIIFDLREALYRYPVEVSIHQTLGDAYMRANRLQDALDSYTKAEELLR